MYEGGHASIRWKTRVPLLRTGPIRQALRLFVSGLGLASLLPIACGSFHRTMQQLQRCRTRDMVSTTRCVPAARRTPGERWPRIAQRRSVDCSIPNVPDPPTPQCLQAVPLAASWPQRSPRCVSATLSAIHCDLRRLPNSCRYSPMPYHATGWIQACVADDSGRQRVPVRRQQAGVMP